MVARGSVEARARARTRDAIPIRKLRRDQPLPLASPPSEPKDEVGLENIKINSQSRAFIFDFKASTSRVSLHTIHSNPFSVSRKNPCCGIAWPCYFFRLRRAQARARGANCFRKATRSLEVPVSAFCIPGCWRKSMTWSFQGVG